MNIDTLMDRLLSSDLDVPEQISIHPLQHRPVEEQERRLRTLLRGSAEACDVPVDRGEWRTLEDHTLVRLPRGARAVLHHASGAIRLRSGQAPMEGLFREMESPKQLRERSDAVLKAIGVQALLGRRETLAFERLWRSLAQGCHRDGQRSEPVLCRSLAAYRHHVDGLPVLGPASLTLQLSRGGRLDAVAMLWRQPSGEPPESARTIPPERGARQLLKQLALQFEAHAAAKDGALQFDCRDGMAFGYFSLPKRRVQRLLAPVYVAVIDVQHQQVSQGLVLVVPATEKPYLPLARPGSDNPTPLVGKTSRSGCCPPG